MGRLEELLQQQIQETSRLGEILKKEREAYEEVIKQTKYPASNNLGGDLKLISQLRRSLEEGIVQNNKLRAQLHEKLARSPDEVQGLQTKLEESERWNMSLQTRLDALLGGGLGVSDKSPLKAKKENTEVNKKVSKLDFPYSSFAYDVITCQWAPSWMTLRSYFGVYFSYYIFWRCAD